MTYTLPSITAEEITFFSSYIYELAGITLGHKKAYLLESRFALMMEELDCASFTELYFLSKSASCKVLEKRLVDAITTHETSFFRDKSPFELLKKKILPELLGSRRQQERMVDTEPTPLSVWSAACSTGQELYSIAIIIKELLGDLTPYRIKLLGSDISDNAIVKATSGLYNDFEINRGLNPERIERFFARENGGWLINKEIRGLTCFRKMNLQTPFNYLGKFDVIFCRNVAVYFSPEDRSRFFRAIAMCMHPESYLIVGSTESLSGVIDLFVGGQHMGAAYYKLRPQQ
nr:protein-glutamate O-methyltransferase CheR [Desulfobulbaceae bacterium]